MQRTTQATAALWTLTTMLGCGTQFIGDVDPSEIGASESTGSTGADPDPGQSATSAPPSEDDGSSDGGDAPLCEDDPEAQCGPEALELAVFYPPSAPFWDPSGGPTLDFDCTITEVAYIAADLTRIIADCGLEVPSDFSVGLPEITANKLAVDQEIHAKFTLPTDGNGWAMVLSIADGPPLAIVFSGTSIDPNPGVDTFAPFSVERETGLCAPPCVPEDQCYSYDRQRLTFNAGGDDTQIWQSGEETMTVDGIDYLVTVLGAQSMIAVNPESPLCVAQVFDYYWFRMADVTP